MDWLNLHVSILDGPIFKGSEPVDRATWLCLLRFCIGQENGGLIKDCAEWGDRKWQQLCGVTAAEVHRPCDLWQWIGGAHLGVVFYPTDKEAEVQRNREAGRQGGRARTDAKSEAARLNGAKHQPKQEPKRNPSKNPTERKGKEEERKVEEAMPPPPSIPLGRKAIDTAGLLAEFGIPNAPKAVAEWRGGLGKVACCRSEAEARMFLRWALHVCRDQNAVVSHWRDVRLLAIEWDHGKRGEVWGAA